MLLKLLVYGPFGYIKNPYNIFDGVIVVIRYDCPSCLCLKESQPGWLGVGDMASAFHPLSSLWVSPCCPRTQAPFPSALLTSSSCPQPYPGLGWVRIRELALKWGWRKSEMPSASLLTKCLENQLRRPATYFRVSKTWKEFHPPPPTQGQNYFIGFWNWL